MGAPLLPQPSERFVHLASALAQRPSGPAPRPPLQGALRRLRSGLLSAFPDRRGAARGGVRSALLRARADSGRPVAQPGRNPRAALPRLRLGGHGHPLRDRDPASDRIRARRLRVPAALSASGRPTRLPAAGGGGGLAQRRPGIRGRGHGDPGAPERAPLAREVWVPVALALTFWALLGMVASSARTPTESRYIYPSAVFLLLILLEFVRVIRPTPRLVLFGVGALLVSLVPNAINLHEQARRIRTAAASERVEIGALELLRNEVPAASIPYLSRKADILVVGGNGFRIVPVTYFAAFDRYGSPGASPAALATRGETQRQAADKVLLKGDDLTLSPLSANGSAAVQNCRSPGQDEALSVPPAGLEIKPQGSRSDVTVAARRFATDFQKLSVPSGSGPLLLKPGRSQAVQPWLVQVSGARVCAASKA